MTDEQKRTEDDKKAPPVATERNRCPICGHEFDVVRAVNVCPTNHYGENSFTPEELIGEDDDYMWCQ